MGLLVVTVEAYRSVVSACEGGRGGLVVEGCGVKGGGWSKVDHVQGLDVG